MFDGGFLGITILAAVVIATVARPENGPLGTLLSLGPMQWVGRISYGLYLWHWPVVVFVTTSTTRLPGSVVDGARVALTFGLATLSFYVVEQPIRQKRIPRLSGLTALATTGAVALAIVLALTTLPSGAPISAAAASRDPGSGPSVRGAGGIDAEVSIAFPKGFVPDHAHPLRVLVVGDSVMQLAQLGIAKSLEATGVVTVDQQAFPGFGLAPGAPVNPPTSARPWHGATAFLQELVRTLHPRLVIGTWAEDSSFANAFSAAYDTILNTALRRCSPPAMASPGSCCFRCRYSDRFRLF
jgi:hypothetical protein